MENKEFEFEYPNDSEFLVIHTRKRLVKNAYFPESDWGKCSKELKNIINSINDLDGIEAVTTVFKYKIKIKKARLYNWAEIQIHLASLISELLES